jgi:glucose/mannose-6-phosphate isomerase
MWSVRIILVDRISTENIDKRPLEEVYSRWPEYFRDALKITCKLDHDPDFYESVFLCGMGGSGTSCDILNDIMKRVGSIPSTVVRGGNVPSFLEKNSLVIVNSASGNTEEAISIMEQASHKKAEVVCISSGGRLMERSESYGNKNIVIPNLGIPRASLPYLIVPGLRLIEPFLKESLEQQLLSISTNLSKIQKTVAMEVPVEFNFVKKLASFLSDNLVFCFTSPSIISAGVRFKNSLNENAKAHCITESILEASHNEVVPFSFKNDYSSSKVLLLKWNNDDRVVNERFIKAKIFFTDVGQPFMEIDGYYDDLVNAIISSIYVLDLSTIYMAKMRNIDPSSTPAIDLMKAIDLMERYQKNAKDDYTSNEIDLI